MYNRSKLLLAGLAATVCLAFAVSTASANRIATSEPSFRQMFSALVFEAAGHNVTCAVTLEGSFHSRTMAKVLEALVGYVSRAVVALPCTGGSARVLTETLPWHIRYQGFTGTLPTITGIKFGLVNAAFRITEPNGTACLAKTEPLHQALGIVNVGAGGAVTGLTVEENTRIPLGGLCAFVGEGRFSGTSTVKPLGEAASIVVTLVQ